MNITYMAVDKDVNIHNRESQKWLKRSVSSIRVDTMTEGIEKLINNQFLFVAINADNINYMPQLKIMRDITNDPILISTSNFSTQEQTKALYNGADSYAQVSNPEDTLELILALLHRLDERAKQRKKPIKIISHGDILILPDYHQVFINDNEIKFTRTEFDIFYLFMNNRGRVLNWKQIYRNVWKNDEYDESANEIVKSAIRRLRIKISGSANDDSLIENLWGIGYKLPTNFE